MRLGSWLLPALLAAPLLLPDSGALACLRFKKPGGAVPPGLREPSDPPPPPSSLPPPTTPPPSAPPPTTGPVTPTPTTPPNMTPPTSAPVTPGDNNDKKRPAADDGTWETWWALNRIEFFPHRYVKAVVSTEGPTMRGVSALKPEVVRAKLWKPLMALKDDKQVFVREAALITIGRVASDESLKSEARKVLLEAIKDPNHLVARAAALGLFYVADEASMLPMVQIAADAKGDTDVRAFLALTLTAMGSDSAGPFLTKLVSADKDADFELVASAIMALGFVPGPEVPRTLKDIYENKKFRAELRAEAVESYGRRGSFEEGHKVLAKCLDDREVEIRRSATIALGILDYRTQAERDIAALIAPYEGDLIPAEIATKVTALKALIPAQREPVEAQIRDVVKRLVHVMEGDSDTFTAGMAAIALGRIASQADAPLATRMIAANLKKERNVVREYQILALAIAKAPEAFDVAIEGMTGKNRQPTTQSAAAIALGILGDAKGNEPLRRVLEEDKNPVMRGYAAMALGILGDDKSQGPILAMLKTTKSPEAMSYGALGLGLLGKKSGGDVLVKRLTETTEGDVAAYTVYSLGLMKDRSKLDALVEIAVNHGNFFVQSAAIAAIGYVSSAEDYPRRHVMARGFNYMMNLNLLESYFYKL
jgi:HEAT repeat protein